MLKKAVSILLVAILSINIILIAGVVELEASHKILEKDAVGRRLKILTLQLMRWKHTPPCKWRRLVFNLTGTSIKR